LVRCRCFKKPARDGVVTLTKEDYEADDILATLATRLCRLGFEVLVVSGDRDTFQLVNDK
jgi:DNA polymerase I